MSRPIHAVILAGGKGTRLLPYTTVLPKPLVPIGGIPILEIVIRQLVRQGVDRVTIAVGHLAKLIKVYFEDGAAYGAKIDYSLEATPLGTMGPLRLIHDLPENFLVLNGDVLTDLAFSEFFEEHCEAGHHFTIASYEREVNSDFGVLETDGDGRLVGFREKPKIPFLVSMGVYAMHRDTLAEIPAGQPFGFDHLMLRMLDRGMRPRVHHHRGFWLDIGRSEDFERAQVAFDELKATLLGPDV